MTTRRELFTTVAAALGLGLGAKKLISAPVGKDKFFNLYQIWAWSRGSKPMRIFERGVYFNGPDSRKLTRLDLSEITRVGKGFFVVPPGIKLDRSVTGFNKKYFRIAPAPNPIFGDWLARQGITPYEVIRQPQSVSYQIDVSAELLGRQAAEYIDRATYKFALESGWLVS